MTSNITPRRRATGDETCEDCGTENPRAPCGHLIRDGQTTIGACELELGHGGEHQREPIGYDFRSSRLER